MENHLEDIKYQKGYTVDSLLTDTSVKTDT